MTTCLCEPDDGFEWTLLQPTGDPTYNGVADATHFNSISSDATGTTLSINNKSANTDDMNNCMSWNEGALASAVTGFINDGTMGVKVRITVVTTPPDSVGYWIGIGFADADGDLSSASGVGMLYKRNATNDAGGTTDENFYSVDNQSGPYIGLYFPGGAYGAGGVDTGALIAGVNAGGHIRATQDIGTITGDIHCLVVAGCDNGADTGPHSGKFKLEAKPFFLE